MNNLYYNSPQEELEALEELVSSSGWKVFKKMLVKHEEYLQEKVNEAVYAQRDRLAGERLAAMKECDKLWNMVKLQIKTLQKEIEGEKNGNE